MKLLILGLLNLVKSDQGFGSFNSGSFFSSQPNPIGYEASSGSPNPYSPPSPPTFTTPPPLSNYPEPAPEYAEPGPQYPEPAPKYSQPAPQYAEPAPKYSQPAPKYSKPAPKYSKHAPYSNYEESPTHNCTVQDEKLTAEVCTPSFISSCEPVTLQGTRIGETDKCLTITRTVCTQTTEEAMVNLCSIKYESKPRTAEGTLVEVGFEKECNKQMVTVCEPTYPRHHGYSYQQGSYQHCKEIAQETCYNIPSVHPKPTQVEVQVPEPVQDCGPRKVVLPSIECEDITEEKCVSVPAIEPADVQAEQCTVQIGPPECNPIELILPKQVCVELVYGHASKPVHPAQPSYSPSQYTPL
ncbi:protein piccolo [Eurytemora carolleeae]|uniref:protein piccolo n=1 Tax=Eurytemora carolleeae TaxID=1294199 RepID=UPI000C764305|nr:protein piccolo [Eurytemora carolleeae]|eukprot:XP_023328541.1 protein piccolo-like [Eurytemora affinis]